jgi:hypothetical protein
MQQSQQALQGTPEGSLGVSPVKVERTANNSSRGTKVSARGGYIDSKDHLQASEPQQLQEQDRGRPLLTSRGDAFAPGISSGNQPSSYWSVPEQTKFPSLIAYYGRDFEAIANFMKTKTVTMVCLKDMIEQHC